MRGKVPGQTGVGAGWRCVSLRLLNPALVLTLEVFVQFFCDLLREKQHRTRVPRTFLSEHALAVPEENLAHRRVRDLTPHPG